MGATKLAYTVTSRRIHSIFNDRPAVLPTDEYFINTVVFYYQYLEYLVPAIVLRWSF
jgi:hypothetical protein